MSYELFIGDTNTYDIQLLKELDGQSEEKEKKARSASLPQKLSDVLSAADLAELDSGVLLSRAAGSYIKGR